jgi:hypothetical protein
VQFRFTGAESVIAKTLANSHQIRQLFKAQRSLKRGTDVHFLVCSGEGREGFEQEWTSIEQALDFLTNLLLPIRADLVALHDKLDGCWWCGHFHRGFDGGPILSADLLGKIASFGVPLYLDTYCN